MHNFSNAPRKGKITLGPNTYPYQIGDSIPWYGRKGLFSGIEIELPKRLPHIYLDNLKRNGQYARFVIDPTQKVGLEGGFDTEFMLYAPIKSQALSLSIMTPDVMEQLLRLNHKYDVEIETNKLRIISAGFISRDSQQQDEILSLGETLLGYMEAKILKWSVANENESDVFDLVMDIDSGSRFFGRYVQWSSILRLLFCAMCTVGFGTVLAVILYLLDYKWLAAVSLIGGVSLFLVFYRRIRRDDRKLQF
jgi:hypothetical protein